MRADQGLRGLSWERVRAYLTVLGADQGLPGRSWGWIRAYVGGLGSGSGRKVALARAGRPSGQGSGSKSGPNASEKDAPPEASPGASGASEAPYAFFYIDIDILERTCRLQRQGLVVLSFGTRA